MYFLVLERDQIIRAVDCSYNFPIRAVALILRTVIVAIKFIRAAVELIFSLLNLSNRYLVLLV